MGLHAFNGKSLPNATIPWTSPNIFLDELKSFFSQISEQIPWSDTYPNLQSGIQTCPKFPDNLTVSCGHSSGLAAMEEDFNLLPEFYRNTVISRLLDSLPFPIVRLRWMKLMPKSCYSLHCDGTPRLHIPLITSSAAYFVFPEGGLINLAEGGMYMVDTTKDHTFFNGNTEVRVHLVGVVPRSTQ